MMQETPSFNIKKVRDLSLIEIGRDYIVIAVDSFGGIGAKEHDVVKLSIEEWAIAILRVPLMEIIASGAQPILVIDALGVEYEPTGRQVIETLKRELSRLGYDGLPLNGSTEDNIPVSSSAAGIVILGIVSKEDFSPGTTQDEDRAFVVGVPKSGPHERVELGRDPEIPDIKDLITIRGVSGVHDILPVGSHGIAYEAKEMAKSANLNIEFFRDLPIDLKKSGGPSTCFLVSSYLPREEIEKFTKAPVFEIGVFLKKR